MWKNVGCDMKELVSEGHLLALNVKKIQDILFLSRGPMKQENFLELEVT